MKKTLLFALLAIGFAGPTMAQDVEDTLVVEKPDRVVVKTDSASMMVEIFGRENNPDYHFQKKLEINQDMNVVKETNSDFDFTFPFSKSTEKGRASFEFSISPCVSLGMVSAIGGPAQLKTNMGQSFEITWHAANITFNFNKLKHWSFGTGLWCNWKNYRMTGYTRFQKVDNVVVLNDYAAGSVIRFSRLHLYSWQVPLLATYRTNNKHLRSTFGLLFNFNSHGNLKTRYSLGGENYKEVEGGIHLNSFTVDLFATLNDFSLRYAEDDDAENMDAILKSAADADEVVYAPGVGKAKNKTFQHRQELVLSRLRPFEAKLKCLSDASGKARLQHPLSPAVRVWHLSPFQISELLPETKADQKKAKAEAVPRAQKKNRKSA